MNQNDYRLQWLKWKERYEIYAFREFRKALKQSFASLPVDNITYDNYQIIIGLNVSSEAIRQAYFDVYYKVGLMHGKRVGQGINRDIKMFDLPFFNESFYKDLLEWFSNNAGDRITSVTETLRNRISLAVEVAARKGYSVDEMQKFLTRTIDSPTFTKWQALRIARTETTTAANFGATVAGDNSGIVLEKEWISTQDSHTRDGNPEEWDHRDMNGVKVGQYELFEMVSKKGVVNQIPFPAAPGSSPGNGINCRCTVALVAKRGPDGFPIMR